MSNRELLPIPLRSTVTKNKKMCLVSKSMFFFLLILNTSCSSSFKVGYQQSPKAPDKIHLAFYGIPTELHMLNENKQGIIWSKNRTIRHKKEILPISELTINKLYPTGTAISEILNEWQPYEITCIDNESPVECEFTITETRFLYQSFFESMSNPEKNLCNRIFKTRVKLTLLGDTNLDRIRVEQEYSFSSCKAGNANNKITLDNYKEMK